MLGRSGEYGKRSRDLGLPCRPAVNLKPKQRSERKKKEQDSAINHRPFYHVPAPCFSDNENPLIQLKCNYIQKVVKAVFHADGMIETIIP
jgi:hypothetical protein